MCLCRTTYFSLYLFEFLQKPEQAFFGQSFVEKQLPLNHTFENSIWRLYVKDLSSCKVNYLQYFQYLLLFSRTDLLDWRLDLRKSKSQQFHECLKCQFNCLICFCNPIKGNMKSLPWSIPKRRKYVKNSKNWKILLTRFQLSQMLYIK